jgi:phage shock protein C
MEKSNSIEVAGKGRGKLPAREAMMYCNGCGQAIADQSSFCSHCGRTVGHPCVSGRLIRPRLDRKIAGVCAGFAQHLDVDVTLVRILWVFLTFAAGIVPGVIAYVLAWIIMPEQAALPPAPVMERQQPTVG